jgi:hypothetical protein
MNPENLPIRTATQLQSDSDRFELASGQILTSAELHKLQSLTDFFWIIVKWDKKLLPTENNLTVNSNTN